jgi:hypothetical protein
VRQPWPDIADLLAAGHGLKGIWVWPNEIGLEIGYARWSHNSRQFPRRDEMAQSEIRELKARFYDTLTKLATETAQGAGSSAAPMAQPMAGHGRVRDPLLNGCGEDHVNPIVARAR